MNLIWMEDPTARPGRRRPKTTPASRRPSRRSSFLRAGTTWITASCSKEWIDRKAMDIVQPDSGSDGITEAWCVSRMAHLQGQLCAPHNWHDALLTGGERHARRQHSQPDAAGSQPDLQSLRTDLLRTARAEGWVPLLPDKPGLGIEIIDDAAKRFPCYPRYPPTTGRGRLEVRSLLRGHQACSDLLCCGSVGLVQFFSPPLVLDKPPQVSLRLQKQGTVTQLVVDGKPFLALTGELGNNTASSLGEHAAGLAAAGCRQYELRAGGHFVGADGALSRASSTSP